MKVCFVMKDEMDSLESNNDRVFVLSAKASRETFSPTYKTPNINILSAAKRASRSCPLKTSSSKSYLVAKW